MGRTRDQLALVRFKCEGCRYVWEAEPSEVIDCPEDEWHPWIYRAECPSCGGFDQRQDPQQRRMLKMWAKATGPRTPEGRAAVAKNLAGHPTPSEALRTRFNRMQHGMYARTAKYFPAKPGRYPQCEGCEYLVSICHQQVACLKRTDLLLKHQIAFETKDPSLLTELRADMQGGITALIDDILLSIVQEGVSLKTPKTTEGKDGTKLLEYLDANGDTRQIIEIHAHPLLRVLTEFLSRNQLSLGDLRMTPKVVEEEEALQGQLAHSKANQVDALEYARRTATAQESLLDMIRQARADTAADPVLLEHQQQSIEHGTNKP